MTWSWAAEMQLPAPALGRRAAPAAAPWRWVQTTHGPALANVFISTRTKPALSEVTFTCPATWRAARAEPGAAQSSRARAAPSKGGRAGAANLYRATPQQKQPPKCRIRAHPAPAQPPAAIRAGSRSGRESSFPRKGLNLPLAESELS